MNTMLKPATLLAEIEAKEREVLQRQKQLKSNFADFEQHLEVRKQRLLEHMISPVTLALAVGSGFIFERFTRLKSQKVEVVRKAADGRKPKVRETFIGKILKMAALVRSVSASFSYAWHHLAAVFDSIGKPAAPKPHVASRPAGSSAKTPAEASTPQVKPDQPALLQPAAKQKRPRTDRASV